MRISTIGVGSILLSLLLASCTAHLFSTLPMPDRSRPIARIETRGGVEYGATTREGILFLGRTAQSGPCRVHYWLGPTLVVEDGYIEPAGGVFYRAMIDLQHQNVRLLPRDLTAADRIFAMVFSAGGVTEVPVRLANLAAVEGDVLVDPGRPLPAGASLFVRAADGDLQFAGLVAAELRLDGTRLIAFAGPDRLREALLSPQLHPKPPVPIHRPDGISIVK